MDNEKKDLINNDQEQKLNDDVTAKIADAAAEIQDEIDGASVSETTESLEDSFTDVTETATVSEVVEPEKEKKNINISVGSLVGIIAGCVVVAALIVVVCMNFLGKGTSDTFLGGKPEGKTVASVDNQKITDEDLKYYIYAESMTQYFKIEGDNATGDFEGYDWDQEVDGKKLSDSIKEGALKNAINDAVTISQGEKILSEEDAWTDADNQQIETTVGSYVSQFGEEGFKLRARSMGISSAKQYARVYSNVIRAQNIQAALEADSSYMPADIDYSKYTQNDRASVKHVLIEATDPAAILADPTATADPTAMDAATAEATANTVADLAKSGTDFNELMEQYNQDTGEPTGGYTFTSGQMVEEFETVAFALEIDEVSAPVKTDYGFHVIKRIPGLYELQGYWKQQAKVNEKSTNLEKMSVKAIMDDIYTASMEVEAEQAAQAAAQPSTGGNPTSGGASTGGY